MVVLDRGGHDYLKSEEDDRGSMDPGNLYRQENFDSFSVDRDILLERQHLV